MGVNAGHANSASNWLSWHTFMGANAGRTFLRPFPSLYNLITGSPGSQDPTLWGLSLSGSYVVDSPSFSAALAELRTSMGRDPTYTGFSNPINYTAYDQALARDHGVEGSNANTVLTLQGIGQDCVVVLPGGCLNADTQPVFFNFTTLDSTVPVYWMERWELYKMAYAVGRWAYLHSTQRVEIYNEPEGEQKFGCAAPAAWPDQFQIRSAAVQAVYADMNLDTGQAQQPTVAASPFTTAIYAGPLGNVTTHPFYQSLGNVSIANLHSTFPGSVVDPSVTNFVTYTYHSYASAGAQMLAACQRLQRNLAAGTAGISTPQVALTEYNVYAAAYYAGVALTPDDPEAGARIALQTMGLMQCASEQFVFSFSMVQNGAGGTNKNGVHFGSFKRPYNIGDSTRSAEAVRQLFAAKGLTILQLTANLPGPLTQGTIALQDANFYYIYVANAEASAYFFSIDLSQLATVPGAPVFVTEVSADRFGEQAPQLTLPADGTAVLAYLMPPFSLQKFLVPVGAAPQALVLEPTDDTTLRAGAYQKASLTGGEPTLTVATSATNTQDATSVVVMKFDTGQIDASTVTAAILTLHVSSAGSGNNQFLVLGLPGWTTGWSESAVTWSGHPNLAPLANGAVVTSIASNFLLWNTTSPPPLIVGHVTFNAAISGTDTDFRSLDVTPYIAAGGPAIKTFMILRQFRADPLCSTCTFPLPGDSLADSFVTFASKETSIPGAAPSLTLYYN